jgi:hypothetical protein
MVTLSISWQETTEYKTQKQLIAPHAVNSLLVKVQTERHWH